MIEELNKLNAVSAIVLCLGMVLATLLIYMLFCMMDDRKFFWEKD